MRLPCPLINEISNLMSVLITGFCWISIDFSQWWHTPRVLLPRWGMFIRKRSFISLKNKKISQVVKYVRFSNVFIAIKY